jgi:hypothetical protein
MSAPVRPQSSVAIPHACPKASPTAARRGPTVPAGRIAFGETLRAAIRPSTLPSFGPPTRAGAAVPQGKTAAAGREGAARGAGSHDRTEREALDPRGPKRDRDDARRHAAPLDPTDPMLRTLASPLDRAGAAAAPAPNADPFAAAARVSLEQVMQRFVRRIAWSGDARTGTARIELGAGALKGATLLLQADGPEVRVSLEVPPGVDAAGWRERIGNRLAARGLRVTSFEIT